MSGNGKYIFSTLTGGHVYPTYKKVEGRDIPVMTGSVLIHGGANLASKVFVTPKGVMTPVSEEEFEQLNMCPAFKRHVDRGFLFFEDRPADPDKVAKDMTPKDTSAPMVPEDFEKAGDPVPSTAADDKAPEISNAMAGGTQRPGQAAIAKAEAEKAEKEKPTGRKRRGRPPKDATAPA